MPQKGTKRSKEVQCASRLISVGHFCAFVARTERRKCSYQRWVVTCALFSGLVRCEGDWTHRVDCNQKHTTDAGNDQDRAHALCVAVRFSRRSTRSERTADAVAVAVDRGGDGWCALRGNGVQSHRRSKL